MPKVKHYTSIDNLPVYNWFKINETNDLSYMLLNRGQMGNKQVLRDAWDKVYAEYIETFGINEQYLKILETKKNLIVMRDEVRKGNLFYENHVNMLLIDLQQLTKEPEKSKSNGGKVHIEKYMGFRINERETTVKEYYEYFHEMINIYKNKAA